MAPVAKKQKASKVPSLSPEAVATKPKPKKVKQDEHDKKDKPSKPKSAASHAEKEAAAAAKMVKAKKRLVNAKARLAVLATLYDDLEDTTEREHVLPLLPLIGHAHKKVGSREQVYERARKPFNKGGKYAARAVSTSLVVTSQN